MNELYHHGILGQKWGVRRFQNKDGSMTSEGKKRYSDEGKGPGKKIAKALVIAGAAAVAGYAVYKIAKSSDQSSSSNIISINEESKERGREEVDRLLNRISDAKAQQLMADLSPQASKTKSNRSWNKYF